MFMWILKMLLKVMKPFAKIAILQALIESFTEAEEEESLVNDDTDVTGE